MRHYLLALRFAGFIVDSFYESFPFWCTKVIYFNKSFWVHGVTNSKIYDLLENKEHFHKRPTITGRKHKFELINSEVLENKFDSTCIHCHALKNLLIDYGKYHLKVQYTKAELYNFYVDQEQHYRLTSASLDNSHLDAFFHMKRFLQGAV